MSTKTTSRLLLHGVNATTLFEAKDAWCKNQRQRHNTVHHLSTQVSDDIDLMGTILSNASLFDLDTSQQCCVLICPSAPNSTWLKAIQNLPINPNRSLCIIYHAQDARYKKSSWFKQLTSFCNAEEFPILYGQALQKWLTQCIQQKTIHLSSQQMRQLTTQTQGNQTLMKQVLDQCAFAYPKQNIPQDRFLTLLNEVTPSQLYQLLDQALLGHPMSLLEHYPKLATDQLQSLFWMTNQAVLTIHQLYSDQPPKLPSWQLKKFHGLTRLPLSFWYAIIKQLSICEKQLKGIHPGYFGTTLSYILIRIARRR